MAQWWIGFFGLFLFGVVMVVGFVLVLRWAVKNDQFKNLDQGARVIFDEDEPEGTQTDYFPEKDAESKS
jgi:nitrogen fixation-related uncharacterized protein